MCNNRKLVGGLWLHVLMNVEVQVLLLLLLQAVWALPPEFHLRLLCALCNDVVNCYNMKAEIAGR